MNKAKPKKKRIEKRNGHMRKSYGVQTEQAAAAGFERDDSSVIKQNPDK